MRNINTLSEEFFSKYIVKDSSISFNVIRDDGHYIYSDGSYDVSKNVLICGMWNAAACFNGLESLNNFKLDFTNSNSGLIVKMITVKKLKLIIYTELKNVINPAKSKQKFYSSIEKFNNFLVENIDSIIDISTNPFANITDNEINNLFLGIQ